MPPKNRNIPLPKYMSPVRRREHVAYKYQRDVPKQIQHLLGRKRWDLSLGGNLTKATARCEAYTAEHDRITALLKNKDTFKEVVMNGLSVIAAAKLRDDVATAEEEGTMDSLLTTWRDTEDHMEGAAKLSAKHEIESLATFAAEAFGDTSHADRIENPSPFMLESMKFPMATAPDDGTVTRMMFDGAKSALDARLAVVVGKSAASDTHRLSTLCERYLNLKKRSDQTRRSYKTKTNRLINHLGDLPLDHYTPKMLTDHADYLIEEGLSPGSVAQYFTPTHAIFRKAIRRDWVPGLVANPIDKADIPENDVPIEVRRWKRFDDAEIKKVWELVQEGWGPESGYTEDRREAFLMMFRVMLYTAMRPVEVFKLTPESVTPDLIHISEIKTKIPRTIPLSKHIADFYPFMQDSGWKLKGKPGSAAGTISDSFTTIIRAGGFKSSRHVLYSTKDTLVDRLQRAQRSDDVIRGITGHVGNQGHLRSYKTRLNDSPEGLAILRDALDGVVYW